MVYVPSVCGLSKNKGADGDVADVLGWGAAESGQLMALEWLPKVAQTIPSPQN